MKQLNVQERRGLEMAKALGRRTLAERNFSHSDLIQLFGMGIAIRLRTFHRHEEPGKHFFSNHFHAGAHNPAGSKLLRRFIRGSNGEQVIVRKAYAALTGRHYNHLNNPEQ